MNLSKLVTINYRSVIYWLTGLSLFVYVTVRAYYMSFTHDEGLTYAIIRGIADNLVSTANNHLGNTFLAGISSKLFGFSELALRLPNILAFIVYLYFIHKAFVQRGEIAFLSLPILLLNPFVLDFFSLSRGYGLAMGFFTASLYYFLQHITQRNTKYLPYALIASVLCIYANFSFLTAILSLHLTCLFFYIRYKYIDFKWFTICYALELVVLWPAVTTIRYLQENGELYFGGENNIINDSLYSLITCSFQGTVFDEAKLSILLLTLAIYVFSLMISKNERLRYLLVSLAISTTLPILLNALNGVKFPVERSLLYLPILVGFCFQCSIESLKLDNYRLLKITVTVLVASFSLLHVGSFTLAANISRTYNWEYDANTKNALEVLNAQVDPNKKYKLGASWKFTPAINYYRETKNYQWLLPVPQQNLSEKSQYYYIQEEDGNFKREGCYNTLATFPDTKSQLLSGAECWN